MKPVFIGIAGGSGAGKSTVADALWQKYPDKVGLIQLDDYRKPVDQMPMLDGITNREHPESLYLDKFVSDIQQLAEGKTAEIATRNERLNPDFELTRKRIAVTFEPKKVMLVEGNLAFYPPELRKLFATTIYLQASHETRWPRRRHFPRQPESYEAAVYKPMHEKYVESSDFFAHHVIDSQRLSSEQVQEKIEEIIAPYLEGEALAG